MLSFPRDEVIPKTTRYLKLAEGLNTRNFQRESDIRDRKTIRGVTSGKKDPKTRTVNNLIYASPIDSEGKTAQYYRLVAAGIDPWSLEDLQNSTFGGLLTYLRILKGMSNAELANALKIKKADTVSEWQRNLSSPRHLDIDAVRDFIGKTNTVLLNIFLAKANRDPLLISPQDMQSMILRDYIFAEYLNGIEPFSPLPDDVELLKELNLLVNQLISQGSTNVYGSVIEHLRDKNKISKQVLGDVQSYKRGRFLPMDVTVAKQARRLGYPLPSIIAFYLLDLIVEERNRLADNTAQFEDVWAKNLTLLRD